MPLILKEHLYASLVIHPKDTSISWLLHIRRVPVAPDSRKVLASSAGQSAQQYPCAGICNPDAVAWLCHDSASCLCLDDKLVKMASVCFVELFLVRQATLFVQNAVLGLSMLLGLGLPCFLKVLLGKGRKEDRQSGVAGNHVQFLMRVPMPVRCVPLGLRSSATPL